MVSHSLEGFQGFEKPNSKCPKGVAVLFYAITFEYRPAKLVPLNTMPRLFHPSG